MTKINQIWKCNVCGNIIEIVHSGADALVCCGQPMVLFEEQTESDEEGKQEKHVPVIKGNQVKIGSVEHPMDEEHYIEWIEAVSESGVSCRKLLKPGDKPEAEFRFEVKQARAYCNLHGLWASK
tara:strand:+ start:316 stop:687 length:372 start_codon:yes stop_codon:yes gene_type:complete